jgi:hypothetical protein
VVRLAEATVSEDVFPPTHPWAGQPLILNTVIGRDEFAKWLHAYLLNNEPQVHPAYLAAAICGQLRPVFVEADAFISHMLYRGSWPGDRSEVERLIGRLRGTLA